jgi:hypothetical protein
VEKDDDFAKGDLVEIQTRDGTTRLCYVRRVNKLTLQLECMSTGEEYRAGKAVCKPIQKAISSEKTPGWGDIEVVTDIAPGIRWISASRHEGFKLDDEANNRLPKVLRKRGGWYEGDVEWTKVVLWYPQAFAKALCFQALDAFLRHFPDSATAFGEDRRLQIEQGPWGSWTPFLSPKS